MANAAKRVRAASSAPECRSAATNACDTPCRRRRVAADVLEEVAAEVLEEVKVQ
jgi:hypothetical protein